MVEELRKTRDGVHHRQTSPDFATMQDEANTTLLAPEVVLILLVPIGYDYRDEFREHLPLVLQYCFIQMDHEKEVVYGSAKSLVAHLIHSFVIRVLPHNSSDISEMERIFLAKRLIKYITSDCAKGPLWNREKLDTKHPVLDTTKPNSSVQKLSSVIERLLAVMSGEEEIRERWASEALLWATKRRSVHTVLRSYQIYRTLKPVLKRKDISDIIENIRKYLLEMSEMDTKVVVIIEIITTLRVITHTINMQKLILYPQLFWLCVALLNSDIIHIYTRKYIPQ